MKFFYLPALLFLIGFRSSAQSTTVSINATGATGSFKTGYINNTAVPSRHDGDLQAHAGAAAPTGNKRGWAVFNVPSVIPPAATVTAVSLRFTINATANAVNATTVGIYGYVGDLSTVTVPATVYTDCNGSGAYAGVAFTTTRWGGAVATDLLPLNASGVGFVNTNAASLLTLGWECNSNSGQTYTITGEGGTATTQPELQITYNCTGVSGVNATVAPNPVCVGSVVTLTGAGTGTTSYLWSGPGGYSSTLMSPTFTATTASAGVYTLTAYNAGGCPTNAVTAALVVNALPAAISGASILCIPGTTTLTDVSGTGTWVSSSPGVATIGATTGILTSASQGTTTVTYTANSTGCSVTTVEAINANPVTISGTPSACPGTTTTLSDASTGGTWSSSVPTTGTVGATTGIIGGIVPGTTVITYNNGCGTPATVIVTINPIPPAISGPGTVCPSGGTITLTDATGGGTWSSTPAATASAGLVTGVITGQIPGTATIVYTVLGCTVNTIITVDPLPNPIQGVFKECAGTTSSLSDVITGGTWTSSTVPVATIDMTTGMVTGVSGGTTIITYNTSCGYVTVVDTSIAAPDPIAGTGSVCTGDITTFADIPTGGTWSSSTPSIATVLLGSGVITGVSAGTATITYTIPPGCSAIKSVNVLPLPPAITGVKHTCAGATTTLSDATTGGTWNSLQTYIARVNATTGVVTGLIADTANITYTDASGCVTTTTVTVNPLPAPIEGGPSITCATSIDTMYDATIGGAWSSGATSIATINPMGVVTTVGGGVAIINYTLPVTGCKVSKTFTVNPLPVPPVTYDWVTNTFFTNNIYVTYQWYDSLQGLITGATGYQTAALYDGYYWVKVTDTNGCTAGSGHATYTTSMTAVPNIPVNTDLHIYPNPAKGIVYIESGLRVRAVISGVDGKTELEQADAKQLNIEDLASGVYFISLYDDGGKRLITQKLIKQ